MKGVGTILILVLLRGSLQASPWAGDTSGRSDPTASPGAHTGILEVRCPVAGVKVFADSQFLGTTPAGPLTLTEGIRILVCVPPDADRWLSSAVTETLTVRAGDHLVRTIDFPVAVHITTEPYGATVRRNGLIEGLTPLDLRLFSTKDLITVARQGYGEATVPLTGGEPQVHILLHPAEGDIPDPQAVYLSPHQSHSSLPITISTGAAVLTGAAAAYFKIRADHLYDDYKLTGNQGSLEKVRNLDLASGISLAASELSFFALAYFLLSR
jgi:hypothetical protein